MTRGTKDHSGARPQGLWRRAICNLRDRGVGGTLRRLSRRCHGWWLERRLGIRTEGSIHADLLGSEGVRFGYQPIDFHSFNIALSKLKIASTDVFADYGCGMGRAVVLAARKPFRRVIGVELSEQLCQIAERNVASAQRRGKLQASEIEIVCADATRFKTPDDLTVLFLYNPFGENVLAEAMERVRESLVRRPRKLQIIYALPKCDSDALASLTWLRRQSEVVTENSSWERMSIYTNCANCENCANCATCEHTALEKELATV